MMENTCVDMIDDFSTSSHRSLSQEISNEVFALGGQQATSESRTTCSNQAARRAQDWEPPKSSPYQYVGHHATTQREKHKVPKVEKKRHLVRREIVFNTAAQRHDVAIACARAQASVVGKVHACHATGTTEPATWEMSFLRPPTPTIRPRADSEDSQTVGVVAMQERTMVGNFSRSPHGNQTLHPQQLSQHLRGKKTQVEKGEHHVSYILETIVSNNFSNQFHTRQRFPAHVPLELLRGAFGGARRAPGHTHPALTIHALKNQSSTKVAVWSPPRNRIGPWIGAVTFSDLLGAPSVGSFVDAWSRVPRHVRCLVKNSQPLGADACIRHSLSELVRPNWRRELCPTQIEQDRVGRRARRCCEYRKILQTSAASGRAFVPSRLLTGEDMCSPGRAQQSLREEDVPSGTSLGSWPSRSPVGVAHGFEVEPSPAIREELASVEGLGDAQNRENSGALCMRAANSFSIWGFQLRKNHD